MHEGIDRGRLDFLFDCPARALHPRPGSRDIVFGGADLIVASTEACRLEFRG